MKYLFTFLIIIAISFNLNAQYFQSVADENGHVESFEIPYFNNNALKSNTLNQLTNWPQGFLRNPSFQNFRGLTLEYIDDDEGQEIVFGINDSLFVFKADGSKLWSVKLNGVAVYPPSTGDIDNDGEIDIVVVTAGAPYNGHIYAFDNSGNIKDGWPVSVTNCWYICAPVLCDLNDNGYMEIIQGEFNTSQPNAHKNRIHILKYDGTNYNENWPLSLPNKPAVTPAVADLNFDGELDIYISSIDSIYAFDQQGNILDNFPYGKTGMKFSYQSPVIVDFHSSPWYPEGIQIYGACHGDSAGFYKINIWSDGFQFDHNCTDNNTWTYSTPLVFCNTNLISHSLVSQPLGSFGNPDSCIFNIAESPSYYEVLSIRPDGLEGFMTVANEGNYVFTGSNVHDANYNGLMYIYDTHSLTFSILDGFPVQVKGSTFMNGVNLGDVTGDGLLDMVVLGADSDSAYINVFEASSINGLGDIYFNPEHFGKTYRGFNTRQGVTEPYIYENINNNNYSKITCYPNPAKNFLNISFDSRALITEFSIYGISGIKIKELSNITEDSSINISELPAGMYFINARNNIGEIYRGKFVKE
jgi:hypothetical protein